MKKTKKKTKGKKGKTTKQPKKKRTQKTQTHSLVTYSVDYTGRMVDFLQIFLELIGFHVVALEGFRKTKKGDSRLFKTGNPVRSPFEAKAWLGGGGGGRKNAD